MTKDEAIMFLAEKLHWQECRSDPSEYDMDWIDLSVQQKHFYETLVRHIIAHEKVVLIAMKDEE